MTIANSLPFTISVKEIHTSTYLHKKIDFNNLRIHNNLRIIITRYSNLDNNK